MIFEACKHIKGLLFIAAFAFVFSCKSRFETEGSAQLKQASKITNSEPREALKILQLISTGSLSEYDYNYYTLLQLRARWNTGINISSAENEIEQVKEYFISAGDKEKAAYACHVTGLVYSNQNDLPKALYNFQAADEWAQKGGCEISDFDYYLIPYNIASVYFRSGQYSESLKYIEKARGYNHNSLKFRIYFDELASLNYTSLNIDDSAWICINRAISNVEKTDDTVSIKRAFYSRCLVLADSKNFDLAEIRCKELLGIVNGKDDFREGLTYAVLADIYNKTGRINEAYKCAQEAKKLLLKEQSLTNVLKAYLFEVLYKTEQKAGNTAKAAEYKKEYDNCIAEHERLKTGQKTHLEEEIKAKSDDIFEIKHQERLTVKAYEKQRDVLLWVTIILFIILFSGGFIWYRYDKGKTKVVNIQGESILASLNPDLKNVNNALFMERVNEIIDKNLSNSEFIVDNIANEMHISRAVFYQKIRETSGVTPNGIVKLKRLKKAAEYLHQGGYRINEVCYKVGFNSPSYFAKCFYKQFGMLPKDFLEQNKENDAD